MDTIPRLSALTASVEQDQRVREVQPHAIVEISSWSTVPPDLHYPLWRLEEGTVDVAQLGYLSELGIHPQLRPDTPGRGEFRR